MSLSEHWLTDPASDVRHCLRLWVPDGAAPADGFPVLIMLDGDWTWPALQDPVQNGLDDCIVLAMGYGADRPQVRVHRTRDYTPPAPDGGLWPDPRVPTRQAGGAPGMLTFLTGPVLGWLASQAPIHPQRITLYGHSYGGLFVLYALAMQPTAIRSFVCASPSLWWRKPTVQGLLDGLIQTPPADTVHITILAGDQEQWHAAPRPTEGPDTRSGGTPTLPWHQALQHRLAGIPNVCCQLEVISGSSHGALLPISARRALTLAAHRP
ncbi:MAG: alpha/beta fold hydrolase [Alcaligenaceae bacterium]|nr:alpha/beta fold hydrolase [Alcaligenaceae bacterium]